MDDLQAGAPQDGQRAELARVAAPAPASASDPLFVTVASFDGSRHGHGPCLWEPPAGALPAVGELCVIVRAIEEDGEGEQAVVIAFDRDDSAALDSDLIKPLVPSLPGSPADGLEILFQTAAMKTMDAGPWRMRYDASQADAYKWSALGAASNPMESESTVNEGAINSASGNTNLIPEIQLPLSGIWYVEVYTRHGGPETASAFATLGYRIGAAVMDDQDAAAQRATLGAANDFGPMRFLRRKTITTAALLKMQARASAGNFYPTGNGANAHGLRAWPVRVG